MASPISTEEPTVEIKEATVPSTNNARKKVTVTLPSVHQALQAVAQDISHIGKNQVNSAQKFKFRGIDDVLNAIHEPLAKHGVAFIPSGISILSETERTTKSGTTQFYVRAAVEYAIVGPAGDSIKSVVLAEASDMGDKVSSKLMSMAFKYLAFQVLSIPVAGMDDADNDTPEQVPAAAPIPNLAETLEGYANALGTDVETLTGKFRTANGNISYQDLLVLGADRLRPFLRQVDAHIKGQKK